MARRRRRVTADEVPHADDLLEELTDVEREFDELIGTLTQFRMSRTR
jgi:hypothetical protein